MPQVVIDNPILNSAFVEPTRHFRFGDEGITNDIVEKRRTSSYFIPIAQPKKKGKQLQFETEWTSDRLEENRLVNLVRERVGCSSRGRRSTSSRIGRTRGSRMRSSSSHLASPSATGSAFCCRRTRTTITASATICRPICSSGSAGRASS